MANFECRLNFLDGDGATPNRTYYVVAVDRADAVNKLRGLAEAADDIILGQITGAQIVEDVSIAGWALKGAPDPTSDAEIQVEFRGQVTGGYPYKTSLPTFDKDTWSAPGGGVAITGAVFAFANTALRDGGFADYRYADVTNISSAKEKIG